MSFILINHGHIITLNLKKNNLYFNSFVPIRCHSIQQDL